MKEGFNPLSAALLGPVLVIKGTEWHAALERS